MIKPTKRGYFIISESEDGVTVEKIIDPAELTTIPIGDSDDNIVEMDTYEITNPEVSDTKFVITIDNDGDEDDGVIISPLASQTAEDDYDPEAGRKETIAIVKKAIGEYVDIPEDEDQEELEESDETVVQSQVQESLYTEDDDESDSGFDFRNPDENTEETQEGTKTQDNEESTQDSSPEVEPDEEELSDVEVKENKDGSIRLTGDVKSLLAVFVGGGNVQEIMQDTGEDKLPEGPSVKIESLVNKIYSKNKQGKLNKLLGS